MILLEFSILCEACSLKNLFFFPGETREPGEVFRPELPGSAPGARRTGEEDPHELVANWPIEIDGDYRTENSMVDLDKWRIVTVITRWYMIWYNIKFSIMYMIYICIYIYICVCYDDKCYRIHGTISLYLILHGTCHWLKCNSTWFAMGGINGHTGMAMMWQWCAMVVY